MRAARAADPAGGPRAPRRGLCYRRPPGGPVPRRPACARPGVGCSAAAADSAGGWHGRHPEGHPAWGVGGDVGRGPPSGQPGPGTSPLPILSRPPPQNYDNPMALGKWKGALQLCGVIIYLLLHKRKQRGKGTFSRPLSREIQGQDLNPDVQVASLEKGLMGNGVWGTPVGLISWESGLYL